MPTNLRTACPYKGTAAYWSVRDVPELPADAVWSHRAPLPAQAVLRDRLASFDVIVHGVLQERRAKALAAPAEGRGGLLTSPDAPECARTRTSRSPSSRRSSTTRGWPTSSTRSAGATVAIARRGRRRRSPSPTSCARSRARSTDVRGQAPENLNYHGAAEPLQHVWIALRANVRTVLEDVTLAHIANQHLPKPIANLAQNDDARLRR